MVYTNLVLKPALGAIEPPQRRCKLGASTGRLTKLAWASIVVLVITGVVNTLEGSLFDTSTGYGVTLLV